MGEKGNRAPSSSQSKVLIPTDLRDAVRKYRELIASEKLNSKTCATQLQGIYDELYRTPPSHFDLDKLRPESLKVVDELWQARVELRKKFVKMSGEGPMPSDCVDAVRRAIVAGRFVEEYVGEWATSPVLPDKKNRLHPWSGSFPNVVKSPDFPSTELRSGDLLLSRGDAFTSAAIARIGDIEGQFSHLAMVYIDEKTGKKFTVESTIEEGVFVAPIEKYLSYGKVRSEIFRFRGDPKVAHQAAKTMYDRASKATAAGANIPYDFHFNLQDDSEIFCAEVAALGYRVASNGRVSLPTHASRMSGENREFIDDIGMSGKTTFAPLDLEVEPWFDLVGEWRDLARTEQSHRKDEVLTAMFAWMQEYHYVLDKTAWNKLSSTVLLELGKWPLFSKLLKSKVPVNMRPRTIEASRAIKDAAERLFSDLSELDEEQHDRTGLWLTPYEMIQALEQMRIDDFSRWEKWKSWDLERIAAEFTKMSESDKPRFHLIFHPVGVR
jgi:hypothetical protein